MKTKNYFLTALFLLVSCLYINAQTLEEAKKGPNDTENFLAYVNYEIHGGDYYDSQSTITPKDQRRFYSEKEVFDQFYNYLQNEYGKNNPNFIVRNFSYSYESTYFKNLHDTYYAYYCKAKIYIPNSGTQKPTISPQKKDNPLKQALTKSLQNIKEGSRLALDQLKITNGDKEDFKDKIVEILLDEGYKVVAKEYLDRLYEEQQNQQSGMYNDRTTVQENNFSGVGYYVNVKQTETAIKVQIINVSTGEYEANVNVKLEE